jgi:pyridoxine kinase
MSVILSISSQVVRGAVGNSVTQFVLQRLGHEVWALPTVLFSNHPGQETFGGVRVREQMLRPVLEALDLADDLARVDALMTGYLPTREHVDFARAALDLVRAANPAVRYIYDPVLGDDARPGKPAGIYIDTAAAERQRTELLPFADIITPNRFELEWLGMRPVLDEETALRAIEGLGQDMVLATSVPGGHGKLVNLLASDGGGFSASVDDLGQVPHGSGDMLTALFAGALLKGETPQQALGFATAGVNETLKASLGKTDLQLIPTQDVWSRATPAPVRPVKVIA